MLTAGAAIAAPATAIALELPATAALASPAAGPASARDRILEMEGPELFRLMDRFIALVDEQHEAEDQERATRARFKAEAPLRPKKPLSKYPDICYDIVRDEPSFEDTLAALESRVGKSKQPGNALGVRLKMSVREAYHELADNPFYTKDGELKRKMMGASQRWEYALYDSAEQTGYGPARRRRGIANKDMGEVVAEILKHKPNCVECLQLQASACLADPGARWIREHNALALLTSHCRVRRHKVGNGSCHKLGSAHCAPAFDGRRGDSAAVFRLPARRRPRVSSFRRLRRTASAT
jgi:hypothetical protein